MESEWTVPEGVAICVDPISQSIPKAQEVRHRLGVGMWALHRPSWTPGSQPSRWGKSTQQDRLGDTQGKNSSAEKPLRVWEVEAENNSALCRPGRGGQPHPACSPSTVSRSPRQVTSPVLLTPVSRSGVLKFTPWHSRASLWRANTTVKVWGTERQWGLLCLRKTRTSCCL